MNSSQASAKKKLRFLAAKLCILEIKKCILTMHGNIHVDWGCRGSNRMQRSGFGKMAPGWARKVTGRASRIGMGLSLTIGLAMRTQPFCCLFRQAAHGQLRESFGLHLLPLSGSLCSWCYLGSLSLPGVTGCMCRVSVQSPSLRRHSFLP